MISSSILVCLILSCLEWGLNRAVAGFSCHSKFYHGLLNYQYKCSRDLTVMSCNAVPVMAQCFSTTISREPVGQVLLFSEVMLNSCHRAHELPLQVDQEQS